MQRADRVHSVEQTTVDEASLPNYITCGGPCSLYTPTRRGKVVRTLKRMFYSDLPSPRRIFRKHIADIGRDGVRVLDLGCGYAAHDLEELDLYGSLKVGVDVVSEFRLSQAPSVRFIRADCAKLPFANESYEIVISRSLLEHLSDPRAVFNEVARVLSPGGCFLFLTPNRWDYVSLAASFVPNGFHPKLVKWLTGRDEEDTFPTYYRANSIYRIRRLADDSGLTIVELLAIREHPHYLQLNGLTYSAGVVFEQVVQRMIKPLRPWLLGICVRA